MNKQILNVALALALSGSALSANAVSYTFTDLGTLGVLLALRAPSILLDK